MSWWKRTALPGYEEKIMKEENRNIQPVTVVIIGAGGRGYLTYAPYSKKHPEQMRVVGAADPDQERLKQMREEYGLPEANCFRTAEELFSVPQFADMAFICTQDHQHVKHGLMAMEAGYDILLEKPISADVEECRMLNRKAKELHRFVTVCHVLRYAPFYSKIKELLDAGELGEPVCIQAAENVGYWHQTHSYVRGKWRDAKQTSPMILAKSCHDLDLFVWLSGSACRSVSSVGDLRFFRKENAPEGAPSHCLAGCPVKEGCCFDAEKIYITDQLTGYDTNGAGWMQRCVVTKPDREKLYEALRTGPYGRCVFHCDNNVVDHQTLSAVMKNGVSISFAMCGLNSQNNRTIHVMGTRGDLWGELEKERLVLNRFGREPEVISLIVQETISGHGGGDYRMLSEMFRARREGQDSLTGLEESLASHYMALAAEESRRLGGACLDVDEFVARGRGRRQ